MEDEEIVLRSSPGDFERFIEGTIWYDIKNELSEWLDSARDGLEDTEASEKEMYRNQGRADAVRRMMLLPEIMRDSLLEEQRDEDHENSNIDEIGGLINE